MHNAADMKEKNINFGMCNVCSYIRITEKKETVLNLLHYRQSENIGSCNMLQILHSDNCQSFSFMYVLQLYLVEKQI